MDGYQTMAPAELWVHYDVEATLADPEDFRRAGEARTAKVKAARKCLENVAYGTGALEVMDIYPVEGASGPVPLLMFIHGGWFMRGTKNANGYMAPPLVDRGIALASIDYALAPDVPLDEIVRQARAALAWLHAHADEHGFDRERVYVAGASAGGHLAAMVAADGWQADAGLPGDVVKGSAVLGGLYDLEPLLGIEPNSWLKMDGAAARRNSPVHALPAKRTPMIVAYGADEPQGFVWQSETYAQRLKDAGIATTVLPIAGAGHFDTAPMLAARDSALMKAMVEMVGV